MPRSAQNLAAGTAQLGAVDVTRLPADARQGKLTSGSYTVGSTKTEINIPSWAIGFRLYPVTNDIRFAIGEDPLQAGSATQAVGATAKGDAWETRLIEAGAQGLAAGLRLLRVSSDAVTLVQFF